MFYCNFYWILILVILSHNSLLVLSQGCEERMHSSGTFVRINAASKFLFNPKESEDSNINQVAHICGEMDLEMPELRNIEEYHELIKFLDDNNMFSTQVPLGMKDSVRKGYFLEGSGVPIRFQTFGPDQPDGQRLDDNSEADCVFFTITETGQYAMEDVYCDARVMPLCQFKKGSMCNPDTQEEDSLLHIGESAQRNYYIGTRQKGWAEAMHYCIKSGKRLLDFHSDYELMKIKEIADGYFQSQSFPKHTRLWTAGNFYYDNEIIWAGEDTLMSAGNVSNKLWNWYKNEPFDQTGNANLETCVSMMMRHSGYFRQGNLPQDIIILLSTTNCMLPNFFLCYDTIGDVVHEKTSTPPPINRISTTEKPLSKKGCPPVKPPRFEVDEPGLTNEETLDLVSFRIKSDLHKETTRIQTKGDGKFRQDFINNLADITKKICPKEYFSHEFLTIMKNLMIIYYVNLPDQWPYIVNEWLWNDYGNNLQSCLKKLNTLEVETSVFAIDAVLGNDSSLFPISPMEETLDQMEAHPDMIIDTLWYMFTLSAGACLPSIKNKQKELWLSDYLVDFNRDFLIRFYQRWVNDGDMSYGIIAGDYDISLFMYNLRACSAAVHEMNGNLHLHFARPIRFGQDLNNVKTGSPLRR